VTALELHASAVEHDVFKTLTPELPEQAVDSSRGMVRAIDAVQDPDALVYGLPGAGKAAREPTGPGCSRLRPGSPAYVRLRQRHSKPADSLFGDARASKVHRPEASQAFQVRPVRRKQALCRHSS
jgi:hypothetical protein